MRTSSLEWDALPLRLGKGFPYGDERRLSQLEAKIAALVPGVTTKAHVDIGPIGKAWAQQAGLAGSKTSNLVSAESGSWLLLGKFDDLDMGR